MTKVPLSVFCEGFPGLELDNLELITHRIVAIDWHAPLEQGEFDAAFQRLKKVLDERDLLLDAVVFGLPGENYADPGNGIADCGLRRSRHGASRSELQLRR